jgi:hypothetical protein
MLIRQRVLKEQSSWVAGVVLLGQHAFWNGAKSKFQFLGRFGNFAA